jgi:hypothetical protein
MKRPVQFGDLARRLWINGGTHAAAPASALVVLLVTIGPVLADVISQAYSANVARLQKMNNDQRRAAWDKYQAFLALPQAEQSRIRKLHWDLERLPVEHRTRLRTAMDRYVKWKATLPLYERQNLDAAAAQGTGPLYAAFREAQQRQKEEDAIRAYWLLPDRPGMRTTIPKLLEKLPPDEIETLDRMSPVERTEELMFLARKHGFGPLVPGQGPGPGVNRNRGPLPPVEPEKMREFLESLQLSRDQLQSMSEAAQSRPVFQRWLLEMYWERHPEERERRIREGGPAPAPADRRNPAKKDGE